MAKLKPEDKEDRHLRVRKSLRWSSIESRKTADDMAAIFEGQDTAWYPEMPLNEYRDWRDWAVRVAIPIAEYEGDELDPEYQALMLLYRKTNPMWICTGFLIAVNEIERLRAGKKPLKGTPKK